MGNFPFSSSSRLPQSAGAVSSALGFALPLPLGSPSNISGIAAPIKPLLPGNAEIGREIYHGTFSFAGIATSCRGAIIFDASVDDPHWLEELHGFAWLAHIEATGLELGRVHARALIWDWLDSNRGRHRSARVLPVACRRLISWIVAAPFLFQGAGDGFIAAFCSSLSRHIRDLQLRASLSRSPATRLDCAMALAFAAVSLKGMESARSTALHLLADRLDDQILADGGHVSRNPTALASLLLDLVPLRTTCGEARIEMPNKLHATIDRMIPMLRFLMHGDDGLAIFQGASDPLNTKCAAILGAGPVCAGPLLKAASSGFARISHGVSTVICDIGIPPRKSVNPRSFLAPLALEFSDSTCRIVVNCGTPVLQHHLATAAGLAEAHSTLTLATESGEPPASLPFLQKLGLLQKSKVTVRAQTDSGQLGSIIEAWHDAYRAQFGYGISRRLFLSSTGTDLRGEDRYLPQHGIGPTSTRFAIRFHLHPAVEATQCNDGSIVLLLPSKARWKFSARGAHTDLQNSICLWGSSGPRKTMQILLTGSPDALPVNWAFKRSADPSCGEEPPALHWRF
jgi:uncharacterized heparinase superfamily protein